MTYIPATIGYYIRSASYAGSRFYAPSPFTYDYTVLRRPVILSFDGFADTAPEFPNPHISHRDRQLAIWGHAVDYLNQSPVIDYTTSILTGGVDNVVAFTTDAQGQFNATAGTNDLALRSAGFYLLSLEGVASAIYAASTAPAPDLVMIYEKLTLQLVNSGSGSVFQQNSEIDPSVQFIGEDGESVNLLHLLNFYDNANNLLSSSLSTQASGITCAALNPIQYTCQVLASPASLLLFSSNNFAEFAQGAGLLFPLPTDPTFARIDSSLPYYISQVGGAITSTKVVLSSGVEIGGIQYTNNPAVTQANFEESYTWPIRWVDGSMNIVVSLDWETFFYAMFVRSVAYDAPFILQVFLLWLYGLTSGIGPAAFWWAVVSLAITRIWIALGYDITPRSYRAPSEDQGLSIEEDIGEEFKIENVIVFLAQLALIVLTTIWLLLIDSNRFDQEYNPSASSNTSPAIQAHYLLSMFDMYDIAEAVFFGIWWGLYYFASVLRFFQFVSTTAILVYILDFIATAFVAGIVLLIVRYLVYQIKIWFINNYGQTLQKPTDWSSWTDQIDSLWFDLQGSLGFVAWDLLNWGFDIMTTAIPLAAAAVVVGIIYAIQGALLGVSFTLSFLLDSILSFLLPMLLERLFIFGLNDLLRAALGGAGWAGGLNSPIFQKWASFGENYGYGS
ncbi:MAG TPA: hypothetical protein VKK79_25060 [Candidatus Lokiarchaeia archaeon]|nr:hypothetical protein [Candidatus Lokiarchaeia archaeon]